MPKRGKFQSIVFTDVENRNHGREKNNNLKVQPVVRPEENITNLRKFEGKNNTENPLKEVNNFKVVAQKIGNTNVGSLW